MFRALSNKIGQQRLGRSSPRNVTLPQRNLSSVVRETQVSFERQDLSTGDEHQRRQLTWTGGLLGRIALPVDDTATRRLLPCVLSPAADCQLQHQERDSDGGSGPLHLLSSRLDGSASWFASSPVAPPSLLPPDVAVDSSRRRRLTPTSPCVHALL